MTVSVAPTPQPQPVLTFDVPDVRCKDCNKKFSECNCPGPRRCAR